MTRRRRRRRRALQAVETFWLALFALEEQRRAAPHAAPLSDELRDVIYLRFGAGFSVTEIAEIYGCEPEYVTALLDRALDAWILAAPSNVPDTTT